MNNFIEKNYYYFQVLFFVTGFIGWVFNFNETIPVVYAILCYIATAGMLVINVFKLRWTREKKMKWGLNVGIPQLTFYALLAFLIYFRFFGTVHNGIPVRLFAITLLFSLILDTFTKEVKTQ